MKKVLLLFGIGVLIGVCFLMYLNQHLYYKAQNTEGEERISLLEQAKRIYPLNPQVSYALGEAHLNVMTKVPDELEKREIHFEKSVKNYKKSLRMNPVSAFSHFGLARVYHTMSYFAPFLAEDSFKLYKDAALLAGHHIPIFFEVGKIYLSRWEELDKENRDFTVSLLKRVIKSGDEERFRDLMQVWEMGVKDYEVMDRILPEKSGIYRMYARFLGEKSLSLEERQEYLARADFLDFKRARDEHEAGENDYFYHRMDEAFLRFQKCLDVLERIHFYQRLVGKSLIAPEEFEAIKKSAYLYLAKSGIGAGKGFDEVKDYLKTYLSMEEKVGAVRELEEYLQRHQVVGEELERDVEDIELFSFQVSLAFRENQYRDIMRVGRDFKKSFVIVPEKNKDDYVRILQLVGDSNQKVDYIYDAVEFYEMALELDPDNLETLVRLRQSLVRLIKEDELEQVNDRIEEVISEQMRGWEKRGIEKGQSLQQTLLLDGSDVVLELELESDGEEPAPLISVFWNGRVVWEGYGGGETRNETGDSMTVSLSLGSRVGENELRVLAVNRGVRVGIASLRSQ